VSEKEPHPSQGEAPADKSLTRHDLGFREVESVNFEQVIRFDVEDHGRLLVRLGGGQMALEVFLGDFDAVHLVDHARTMGRREGDTEVFLVFARLIGMSDDQREDRPRAPREPLHLTTLLVLDALLDGGEIGEVDTRAVDAFRELLQLHALEGGGGLGFRLERQFDELTLLVVTGVDEGESLRIGDGVGHGVVLCVGVLD